MVALFRVYESFLFSFFFCSLFGISFNIEDFFPAHTRRWNSGLVHENIVHMNKGKEHFGLEYVVHVWLGQPQCATACSE